METNETQRLAQIIRESIDSVDITNRFKYSEPYIMRGNELLISKTESEIISYDQSINDYIIGKIDDSERVICIQPNYQHNLYKSSAMASVIGELNHNIVVADEQTTTNIARRFAVNQVICPEKYKEKTYEKLADEIIFKFPDIDKKENHPYGWYRKFEKKRF